MENHDWEEYASDIIRIKVEGGHIYETSHGICFVSELDLTRYQAHLRDAYKKGYEDGQSDAKSSINTNLEL